MSKARIEIDRNKKWTVKPGYKGQKGKWHWEYFARIIAKNGKETWRTSETYKRKASVYKAIEALSAVFADPFAPQIYNIIDKTKGTKGQ